MRVTDIIMKKRDGGDLSREELSFVIEGYVDGSIPDYQISSWLMSVFFRGMNFRETADLTDLMLHSGKTMDLSGIAGPFIDKHSTGGVGDKISLILAPLVAACGIKVPMMSGRALGHTGGTLDKLESIPGYVTSLTEGQFRDYLSKDGFAMTGQTAEIVPADKKLYALRDVTATVESIPLITASILSKKVAEGAQALVFDVKCGSGAFMKTETDAELLATSLVRTGEAMGKRVVGVITEMGEPLGNMVGNFFEIEETIDCLECSGTADVMELTYRLGAWMLVAGGIASNVDDGEQRCRQALESGRALSLFMDNVQRQGGDAAAMMRMRNTHRSEFSCQIQAPRDAYVGSIDAFKIGLAGVYLGVGRNKTEDPVYPDVGFIFKHKGGDAVKRGDPVCTVYGKDASSLEAALPLIEQAFTWSDTMPAKKNLIIKEITAL